LDVTNGSGGEKEKRIATKNGNQKWKRQKRERSTESVPTTYDGEVSYRENMKKEL
jgi:hypothetical protein